MTIKKIYKIIFITVFISAIVLVGSLFWIFNSTKEFIYSDMENIPHNSVGLVPGCNKYISSGVINQYYTQRINAAYNLFINNKIDYILVSGDNAHASYDEPRQMRNSLLELGIPNDKIFSDYAGFRTLDTIVRANEVFMLDKFTFISQNFQNQRGVFIGRNKSLTVIAYDANNTGQKDSFKTEIREIFAKIKMLLDLYILDKEPKFLGEEIVIVD